MKKAFLLFLFLLCAASTISYADGGFIPRDSSVYYSLYEDQQIAVVDILDKENIKLDMFISLTDKSSTSNEVVFFLPVYEKPDDFMVEEMSYNEFAANVTKAYDDFIDQNSKWRSDAKSRILLSAGLGWMVSGGPALFGIFMWQLGVFNFGQGTGLDRTPENVYVTEHSRTEAYNVSSEEDLEALLSNAPLSDEAKQKIRDYKGTYLYFITLKTVPNKAVDPINPYREEALNSLGIHFSFTTRANDNVYTYPLGTGKTWHNAIKLTRVYVRNPRSYSVGVTYPILGEKTDSWDYYSLVYYSNETKYEIKTADDANHIVNRITYYNSNPGEDVNVLISESGPLSTLEGLWITVSRSLYGIVFPVIIFFLPLFFWLVFFPKFIAKAVNYPTKRKMHLSSFFYFIVNAFVQTSMFWVTINIVVGAYLVMMFVFASSWYNYSSLFALIFLGLGLILFLIQFAFGAYIVSYIYKLRNKLDKPNWKGFLATYLLSMLCFIIIAGLLYFIA
jgi:hypothetical protein